MKKKIIGGIVVLLLGGIAFWQFSAKTQAKDKKEISKPKTVKIWSDDETNVEGNVIKRRGVIKGDKEVYLSPKAEGRVKVIYKEIGQRVYRGQLLATIDGRETALQSQVARNGYNLADKSVSKTKKFFKSQIKQAEKAKKLAKEAYEMAKQGSDQEAIAKAKANYELAKKAVDTAEAGYKLQKEVAEGQRDIAYSQWKMAGAVAGNNYVRAPFSGVIAQVMVEVGDLVSPQRPMFLLVDDSQKEVEISVEGELLDDVKVGQEIKVITQKGVTKTVKIKAVSPMIDTHSRKGIIKISLPKDEEFVLGEYLDVLIPQKLNQDINAGVFIPQKAVVQLYHDTFVFVVENDHAKKIKVELGEILGDQVLVKSGLNAEQAKRVIVEGQQYLNDGDVIKNLGVEN